MKHQIKIVLLAFFCLTTLACSSNDDTMDEDNNSSLLIGEWLRSDYTIDTNTEYKIIFLDDADFNGLITIQVTSEDGITSSASPFNWFVDANQLTIIEVEETTTTPFEFATNGNLILADFSEHEFIKQ